MQKWLTVKSLSCKLLTLREKVPNMEFFLVRIFRYSGWIRESMDQKKLHIWTFFTKCHSTLVWNFVCQIVNKVMFEFLICKHQASSNGKLVRKACLNFVWFSWSLVLQTCTFTDTGIYQNCFYKNFPNY